MLDDQGQREFGDVDAALDAFEQSPLIMVVTDGTDLRTVALNSTARNLIADRFVPGQPILEGYPRELGGQGWSEAYSIPMVTGEALTMEETRIQLHQADGSIDEIYLDAYFAPRLDATGRPRGTILAARDVTARVVERRALQQEVAELREQYSAARGSVLAMQRALLPDIVPVTPTFDIAARYVLASEEHAAGGDWFDTVAQDNGSLVLVVGDVVGHGESAAVAMGQLRSVLLSQLRTGTSIAEALSYLDGYAVSVPAARHATVCVVTIDADGNLEYCTAGHPPPLLLAEDEVGTRYLPPTGAGPLTSGTRYDTGHAQLANNELVVLYTDGILERPNIASDAASLQLRTTSSDAARNVIMPAGAPASAPERVCTLTIELLTRTSGHTDDITVLAAQRHPSIPTFELTLPGSADALREVREALRDWLSALDPRPDDLLSVLTATTELVTNVLDHAHLGKRPQPFTVAGGLSPGGVLTVTVADSGSWKMPVVTAERGRGLALVRALVDRLAIDESSHGTTATIEHRLTRPAGLLNHAPPLHRPRSPAEPEFFDVYSHTDPESTVTVVGPLDDVSCAAVSGHLEVGLTVARNTLTVDLSRVTILSSAGVDLLFNLREQADRQGLDLTLLAPNGTPAQHVLDLVHLSLDDTAG